MKLYEITSLKIMPHLYLDMDGVQADFMGQWENMYNLEKYKNARNLDDAIKVLANSSEREVYEFFRDLPLLPGGSKLISWLKINKIPYTVLSAPLRGPYKDASIQGKKEWLDKYNPGTSNNAIFTSGKYKYATSNHQPNILVDDNDKYLDEWKEKHGIGIKHTDETTDLTIKQLKQIYSPFRNK